MSSFGKKKSPSPPQLPQPNYNNTNNNNNNKHDPEYYENDDHVENNNNTNNNTGANRRLKCFVRVRPVLASDRVTADTPPLLYRGHDGRSICVSGLEPQTFDEVFAPDAPTSSLVAAVVVPGVADVLSGRYGAVILYGMTSSGKTYTTAQILPAFVNSLIQIASEESAEIETKIFVECVQVYLESIYDLLDPSKKNLQLRESEDEGVFVQDATQIPIENEEDFASCWELVHRNRAVASTQLNAASSRSHCIVTLRTRRRKRIVSRVLGHNDNSFRSGNNSQNSSFSLRAGTDSQQHQQQQKQQTGTAATSSSFLDLSQQIHQRENLGALSPSVLGPYSSLCILRGRMQFADLAGSERLKKSGSEGVRQMEAQCINQSLSTLGKVVHALADRHATHVPYRDSKLTRLLQDALGCGGTSSVIVTVSPNPRHSHETKLSLNFGMRAMQIVQTMTTWEAIDPHSRLLATQDWLEQRVAELERTSLLIETDRDAAKAELNFYKKSMFEKSELMNRKLQEKEDEMKKLVERNIDLSNGNSRRKNVAVHDGTSQCNLIKEFADSYFCSKCLKKQQKNQAYHNKDSNEFEYGALVGDDDHLDRDDEEDEDEEMKVEIFTSSSHHHETITMTRRDVRSQFFQFSQSLHLLQQQNLIQLQHQQLSEKEAELRRRVSTIYFDLRNQMMSDFFNGTLFSQLSHSLVISSKRNEILTRQLAQRQEQYSEQQQQLNSFQDFRFALVNIQHDEDDERHKISKKFLSQRVNFIAEFYIRAMGLSHNFSSRRVRAMEIVSDAEKSNLVFELDRLKLENETQKRILETLNNKREQKQPQQQEAENGTAPPSSFISSAKIIKQYERGIQCGLLSADLHQERHLKLQDKKNASTQSHEEFHLSLDAANNNTKFSTSCQTSDDVIVVNKTRRREAECQTNYRESNNNNNNAMKRRNKNKNVSGQEFWWNEDESLIMEHSDHDNSRNDDSFDDDDDEATMLNNNNNNNQNRTTTKTGAARKTARILTISMGTNTEIENFFPLESQKNKPKDFSLSRSTQCNIRPRRIDAETETGEEMKVENRDSCLQVGCSIDKLVSISTTTASTSSKNASTTCENQKPTTLVDAQMMTETILDQHQDEKTKCRHSSPSIGCQVPIEWNNNIHSDHLHEQITQSILKSLQEKSASRRRSHHHHHHHQNGANNNDDDDDENEARRQYESMFQEKIADETVRAEDNTKKFVSVSTQTLCDAMTQYSPQNSFNNNNDNNNEKEREISPPHISPSNADTNELVAKFDIETAQRITKLSLSRSAKIISATQRKSDLLLEAFPFFVRLDSNIKPPNNQIEKEQENKTTSASIGIQCCPTTKTQMAETMNFSSCSNKLIQTDTIDENQHFSSLQRSGRLLSEIVSPSATATTKANGSNTKSAATTVARPNTSNDDDDDDEATTKKHKIENEKSDIHDKNNNNSYVAPQEVVRRVLDLDAPTSSSATAMPPSSKNTNTTAPSSEMSRRERRQLLMEQSREQQQHSRRERRVNLLISHHETSTKGDDADDSINFYSDDGNKNNNSNHQEEKEVVTRTFEIRKQRSPSPNNTKPSRSLSPPISPQRNEKEQSEQNESRSISPTVPVIIAITPAKYIHSKRIGNISPFLGMKSKVPFMTPPDRQSPTPITRRSEIFEHEQQPEYHHLQQRPFQTAETSTATNTSFAHVPKSNLESLSLELLPKRNMEKGDPTRTAIVAAVAMTTPATTILPKETGNDNIVEQNNKKVQERYEELLETQRRLDEILVSKRKFDQKQEPMFSSPLASTPHLNDSRPSPHEDVEELQENVKSSSSSLNKNKVVSPTCSRRSHSAPPKRSNEKCSRQHHHFPCQWKCDDNEAIDSSSSTTTNDNDEVFLPCGKDRRNPKKTTKKSNHHHRHQSTLDKKCQEALKRFEEWKSDYIHRRYQQSNCPFSPSSDPTNRR